MSVDRFNNLFGVYIHWPFCAAKCPYCDFNSHVHRGPFDEAEYLKAYQREIAATAAQVRDPNFRVQVAQDGLHVYNRDGIRTGTRAFDLWPQLGLENDASHAFYMGVELAHAQIAWQLGKRYVQDQPLDWGAAVEREAENLDAWCAPGTTRSAPKKTDS